MDTPDVNRLQALFKYHDWGYGGLEWLDGRMKGEFAGTEYTISHGRKELRVRVDGQSLLAGKIVWALVYGWWPEVRIRFKDGDRTHICISNIELTSRGDGPGR